MFATYILGFCLNGMVIDDRDLRYFNHTKKKQDSFFSTTQLSASHDIQSVLLFE